MSRRLREYRHLMAKESHQTAANIMARHGKAKDRNGATCSLPINPDKAARLAASLHRPK